MFRVYRKGNVVPVNTYRFPLKGCMLRRLSGLRSHFR
ncbi:peptide chain release factor 1 [Parabacteroides distasonis]|nr:peptide chain release factor 1 [Parabacteroides distasonis]